MLRFHAAYVLHKVGSCGCDYSDLVAFGPRILHTEGENSLQFMTGTDPFRNGHQIPNVLFADHGDVVDYLHTGCLDHDGNPCVLRFEYMTLELADRYRHLWVNFDKWRPNIRSTEQLQQEHVEAIPDWWDQYIKGSLSHL